MIELTLEKVRAAANVLANASSEQKTQALMAAADALEANTEFLLESNARDLQKAKRGGLSEALLDRLTLTVARIYSIAEGVREVARLKDPVGEIISKTRRPNGLEIVQKRVPVGVIGIIFESRPNVTADAAALCVKAGNACILRGGKEALNSNRAICDIMRQAMAAQGLNAYSAYLVSDPGYEAANEMMAAYGKIDLLIPRGGAGLIKSVVEKATVPVIETGTGNCHVYIEKTADPKMAVSIVYNAKTSRPSVCNAAETLLIDGECAAEVLPMVKAELDKKEVILYGCEKTRAILGASVYPATDEHYEREFLNYEMAVKVVSGIDEAIEHISRFGTKHSEAIVTRSGEAARKFTERVDAAAVYVNASTRFTDGGEFGMGAEIGISTQKLHARGPMGLEALTTYKYIVTGDGQIRK